MQTPTDPSNIKYIDYAEYYDYDHDFVDDIPMYLDYAQQCGSPILELACGTGRVLIPLAEAGFEIHGLDLNENMLAVCKVKVGTKNLESRVQLHLANMADFDMASKDFTLAFIAVRSFMHLYTQGDQLACLENVYEHLRPGGLLIIDIYAPNFKYLAQEPDRPFEIRREFDLPNGHHVVRMDRFLRLDLVNQINHGEMHYQEYGQNGTLFRERILPIDTRYTFKFELQLLLERVGFEIVDFLGDFEKKPYDGIGEIIPIARKPLD